MTNIIKMYRGLDILRKYLGEESIRPAKSCCCSKQSIIYAGYNGSAEEIDLTEVEKAMLEDAGWHIDPIFACWATHC
jgi:hypothetical protein